MRLVLVYLATLLFGTLISLGIALLVGIWFPRAKAPVFVVLTIWWGYTGWRHANWLSGKRPTW